MEGDAVSGSGDGMEEAMGSGGLRTGRWKQRSQSHQYSSERQQEKFLLSMPIPERISDLPSGDLLRGRCPGGPVPGRDPEVASLRRFDR